MSKQGTYLSIGTLGAGNRRAATDPRNLVYAFLGLAKKVDDPLLNPDYSDSNSVLTVFINLIEHSTLTEKSLDIICMSQGVTGKYRLPSWCQDRTRPLQLGWDFDSDFSCRCPFPLMGKYMTFSTRNIWHASGDTTPTANITRSPPILVCKGICIDSIELIGKPMVLSWPFVWNSLLINLHSWEKLVLNHFRNPKNTRPLQPGGPSICDVSDQCHRFITSMMELVAPIPDSFGLVMTLKLISKPAFWLYRKLQRSWRKIRLPFKGCEGEYISGGTLVEAYVRTLTTDRLAEGNRMTDCDYRSFWSKDPKSQRFSSAKSHPVPEIPHLKYDARNLFSEPHL